MAWEQIRRCLVRRGDAEVPIRKRSLRRCEVRIRLPLSRRTRNYVGTIFGGSLYGALDPIYMIMLIKALGPEPAFTVELSNAAGQVHATCEKRLSIHRRPGANSGEQA